MYFKDKQLIIEQTKPPKKITGTKFASILGKNPYATPFATWCDITHAYDFPFEANMFTEAGNTIEPYQANYVSKKFEGVVRPIDMFGENYFSATKGNFFSDDIFGGMWDYIQVVDDQVVSVFEMKTTGYKKRELWEQDIPEYYALQAALYAYLLNVEKVHMVVSFLQWKDYSNAVSYVPTDANSMIIDFNLHERYPTFEKDYIQPAKEWWNRFVLTGVSPDYSDEDKDLVEELIKLAMPNKEITAVNDVIKEVNDNVEYFNSVSEDIIKKYCDPLDDIMKRIKVDVIDDPSPATDVLEKYLLELSNALYFIGEQVEKLGVYDDVSKASAKEVYNNLYVESQSNLVNGKKPTVGESTAVAEKGSIYHNTVNSIYSRSYKTFKFKIDAAYDMVRSLSKIISKRMIEMGQLPERSPYMVEENVRY